MRGCYFVVVVVGACLDSRAGQRQESEEGGFDHLVGAAMRLGGKRRPNGKTVFIYTLPWLIAHATINTIKHCISTSFPNDP